MNDFWVLVVLGVLFYLFTRKKKKAGVVEGSATPGPTADPSAQVMPTLPFTVAEEMDRYVLSIMQGEV